ncbi:MAG: hypothetical protein II759_00890, partial [Lachnospiraceae bacterium]|nr:hypothetical protein [Lachnospiraceae bacterium]
DLVTMWEAGKSRGGHPIYVLKIGEGSRNAFMFGCPHPNEPMGCMMLEYFTRYLCEHDDFRKEFDYTWYLIKSIDLDGTKLNEGWFKGPFTLYNYARNFYRPIGSEQPEWTFPFDYKNYKWDTPIPETQVLMKIIDDTKPAFMFSLHNAGFGGAYWYLTKEAPEIYDKLYAAAEKNRVPLHLGEPEAPFIPSFSKAIYKMLGMADEYDFAEKYGEGDPAETMFAGDSSDSYAKKYGTFCLVAELPYFYSPKIEDTSELPFTRLEAVEQGLKENLEISEDMAHYYDQYRQLCGPDNVFVKIVGRGLDERKKDYDTQLNFARQNEDNKKPCKVSEEFDNLIVTKFYKMLSWGLLIRGAKYERDRRGGTPEEEMLNGIIAEMEEKLKTLSVEVEEKTQYSVVDIKRLVGVQLESGMIVADYVKNNA